MNKILICALIFFIEFTASNITPAQWVQMNGPYGGSVEAVAFDSSGNIFAGTANGVFRSTDNGSTWTKTGLTTGRILHLTVAPNEYIFAGTNSSVLRSSDHGSSWENVSTGLPHEYILTFAVSADGSTIFTSAGNGFTSTDSDGVFRSTNDGNNWTQINTGLTNHEVNALAVLDTNIFAGTTNGIYRSTDNGDNWIQTSLNNDYVNAIAVSLNGSKVLAGTNYGIFLSTDMGNSWSKFGLTDTSVSSLVISPDGSAIFAASTNSAPGVYRFENNGMGWTTINTGLTDSSAWSLSISHDGSTLFACTAIGIFVSNNEGNNWTLSNTGITNASAYSITLSPDESKIYAGTDEGLFVSNNSGGNWIGINNGLPNAFNSAVNSLVFTNENGTANLYAGTYKGVYQSTDNGADWSPLGSGLTGDFVYNLVATPDGSTFYAGTEYGDVFRYSSGSWEEISNGLPNPASLSTAVNHLCITPDGSTIYAAVVTGLAKVSTNAGSGESTAHAAGTMGGGIFRMSIDSTNWTRVDSENFVNTIVTSPSGLIFAGTYDKGVVRSTDNGKTWTEINKGLTDTTVITLAVSSDGKVIFAGTNSGIFMSIDNGNNWMQINTGLPDVQYNYIDALAVSKTTVFTGIDGNGLWERPLSELTAVKKPLSNLPVHFNLQQNYPNPFNPTTTIQYDIPKTSHVTLRVYDILGNVVMELVNKEQRPGRYSVQLSSISSQLSSGVYFYQLNADGSVQTKKMILLK